MEGKALKLPADMKAGDVVSVFSDLEGRCTRGATSFQGKRAFVGNGVARMDRSSIFCSDKPVKYDDSYIFTLLHNVHSKKNQHSTDSYQFFMSAFN